MHRWLAPLFRYLERQREQRRLQRALSPETIRTLAREVRELARVAGTLWPEGHDAQNTARRVLRELDHLDEVVALPEFGKLPTDRRRMLRDSLEDSRRRLTKTVGSAPPVTTTLQ